MLKTTYKRNKQCVVPNCDSNYLKIPIQMMAFPKDPQKSALWKDSLGEIREPQGTTSYVCIKHFDPDDIVFEGDPHRNVPLKLSAKAIPLPLHFEGHSESALIPAGSGYDFAAHVAEEMPEIPQVPELHDCRECGQVFRIAKMLFDHQITEHENGVKLSSLFASLPAEETLYSSDSDQEYVVRIKVTKKPSQRAVKAEPETVEEEEYLIEEEFESQRPKKRKHGPSKQYPADATYTCHECQATFQYRKSFDLHNTMKHKTPAGYVRVDLAAKDFVCPKCHRKLTDLRCFRKHLKVLHNLAIENDTQRITFRNKDDTAIVRSQKSEAQFPLIRSRSPNTGRTMTRCGLCDYGPFYGYTTVYKHQAKMHGRPFVQKQEMQRCEHCSKTFPNRDCYKKHLNKVHQALQDVPCQICRKKIKSSSLQRHLRLHENEIAATRSSEMKTPPSEPEQMESWIVCGVCQQGFAMNSGDFESHSCLQEVVCNQKDCNRVLIDAQAYNEHLELEHGIRFEEIHVEAEDDQTIYVKVDEEAAAEILVEEIVETFE